MKYVAGKAHICAIISFCFVLISCGKLNSESGLPSPAGIVVETSDYPAVVMVVLPNGSGICTGTFISERAVLTAAHCVLDAGRYQVVSSFGTFSTFTVEKLGAGIVEDPNDIGLVLFNTDVADRAQGQVLDMADSVFTGDTLRLVGFGCNNLNTRRGAGTKRTGTNMVADMNDYVEFYTPASYAGMSNIRGILGPGNRSASCFGDSGGPALKTVNGELKVAAVTHAGGIDGDTIISQYVNVGNRADNRAWLSTMNSNYSLNIQGL